MARNYSFNRWTEEDVEILVDAWPRLHEQEVKARLGDKFSLIAIRSKATKMGLAKVEERWARNKFAYQSLAEAELKILELVTIQRCLQEKIRRLEAQIKAVSLRAYSR